MYDVEGILSQMESDLMSETPGTDAYKNIADSIAKLASLTLEEDKYHLERATKVANDDLEERKFKEEKKNFWIKTSVDAGVKMATFVGGILLFAWNLRAEANGLRSDGLFSKSIDRLINQK